MYISEKYFIMDTGTLVVDGKTLKTYSWTPEGEIKALVCLSHGWVMKLLLTHDYHAVKNSSFNQRLLSDFPGRLKLPPLISPPPLLIFGRIFTYVSSVIFIAHPNRVKKIIFSIKWHTGLTFLFCWSHIVEWFKIHCHNVSCWKSIVTNLSRL